MRFNTTYKKSSPQEEMLRVSAYFVVIKLTLFSVSHLKKIIITCLWSIDQSDNILCLNSLADNRWNKSIRVLAHCSEILANGMTKFI